MGRAAQEEEDKRVPHGIFLLSLICLVAEKTKGEEEGGNFVFYVLDFEQWKYLLICCEETMEKKNEFSLPSMDFASHVFSTTKQWIAFILIAQEILEKKPFFQLLFVFV